VDISLLLEFRPSCFEIAGRWGLRVGMCRGGGCQVATPLASSPGLSGRGGTMYARPENCPSAAQLPHTYVVQLKPEAGFWREAQPLA
jgi:hypothetical protein